MAYNSFKPTIWSKHIQHGLEKAAVLQEDCNKNFMGEVGLGKTVKIVGVSRPAVETYVPGADIEAAQTPSDTAQTLEINQYKYTHFLVDDIDKAQAIDGMMEAYMQESIAALAEARDSYIAAVAAEATLSSASLEITTPAKAREAVEDALMVLWSNGVKVSDEVVINVSPWFYMQLKNAITSELSHNVEQIRNGIIGTFNGAAVKLSNNLHQVGGDDYMMVRTKNAIAFASGIEKCDVYRPDLQFADAVKVLDTYGAKLIRPKELYVIKANAGA